MLTGHTAPFVGAQARLPAAVSKGATAFLLPCMEILTFADKEEATYA